MSRRLEIPVLDSRGMLELFAGIAKERRSKMLMKMGRRWKKNKRKEK
jgi:hypothetical protein